MILNSYSCLYFTGLRKVQVDKIPKKFIEFCSTAHQQSTGANLDVKIVLLQDGKEISIPSWLKPTVVGMKRKFLHEVSKHQKVCVVLK